MFRLQCRHSTIERSCVKSKKIYWKMLAFPLILVFRHHLSLHPVFAFSGGWGRVLKTTFLILYVPRASEIRTAYFRNPKFVIDCRCSALKSIDCNKQNSVTKFSQRTSFLLLPLSRKYVKRLMKSSSPLSDKRFHTV